MVYPNFFINNLIIVSGGFKVVSIKNTIYIYIYIVYYIIKIGFRCRGCVKWFYHITEKNLDFKNKTFIY